MCSYPGKLGYPTDYDPRKRPWYKLGQNARQVRWGNPYLDLQGQGLVLPGAIGIFNESGRFFGVAGMDITFDYIIETLLKRRGASGFVESYLVDDNGRIVIRSSQKLKKSKSTGNSALSLAPFPYVEIRKLIQMKRSGIRQIRTSAGPRLIAFQRLASMGWFYVEEARLGSVLSAETYSNPVIP